MLSSVLSIPLSSLCDHRAYRRWPRLSIQQKLENQLGCVDSNWYVFPTVIIIVRVAHRCGHRISSRKIRAGERQMAKGWREGLERGNANYWLKVSLRHLFFVFPHDSNTTVTKIQMLIKSRSLLLTSLARQCYYNLGTTLPFDPSVEVIRYQHTQMTSEPIKQQYSRSGMISL